jgi:hypothetical protein
MIMFGRFAILSFGGLRHLGFGVFWYLYLFVSGDDSNRLMGRQGG